MYDYKDLQNIPMYEIIEDYAFLDNQTVKNEIFENFCEAIWKGNGRKRITEKNMTFKVKRSLEGTPEGELFKKYSHVPYYTYQKLSESNKWHELLLRKILNLYVVYCDKSYISSKKYLKLVKEPQSFYYSYISGDKKLRYKHLVNLFEDWEVKIEKEKQNILNRKIDISWYEFKPIIENFLRRIFDNCVLLENYNKRNLELYDKPEDCYYVKYFAKSLEGYLKNWQKRYFNVRQHKKIGVCVDCGVLIERTNNSKKFCTDCAKKRKNASNRRNKDRAVKRRLKAMYEPGVDLSEKYKFFKGGKQKNGETP